MAVRAILILLVLSVGLAACGKKPGSLRPEEADKTTTYPRTYPIK